MRVFIISPAGIASGGPELLHQFGRCLINNGINAYMLYLDANGTACPVPEVYWKYNVPYVTRYIDSSDSVLVLAETRIHHINLCTKGTVMVWWLSVDHYILNYKDWFKEDEVDIFRNPDIFNLKTRSNVIHFVQSYYAKDFLEKRMGISEFYFLGDYINDEITRCAVLCREKYERKNVCLFNPRKGYEKLEPVIRACREDIRWIPLTGYKPLELAMLMCQAKVYVDFGYHPGKDCIPREAAICGCCILTNREGSAAYQEDVGIPEQYKIEATEDVEAVLEKIYDLVDHYEERKGEYSDYRIAIGREKEDFMQEVYDAVTLLKERAGEDENIGFYSGILAEHGKMLDSFDSATARMKQLISEAKEACTRGRADVMDKLLFMDYMIQIIRESLYTELAALSGLEGHTAEGGKDPEG